MSVDNMLNTASAFVKKKGIKILVIDPYNRLEYQDGGNLSETLYISKLLDKITNFARFNDVLVFLVAHPRKMQKGEVPTMYDISGSANFFNKADYGITVHKTRNTDSGQYDNSSDIHIQKIKFKHLGNLGCAEMNWNYNNGRYEQRNNTVDLWDNSDWLNKNETQINDIEPNMLPLTGDMPF